MSDEMNDENDGGLNSNDTEMDDLLNMLSSLNLIELITVYGQIDTDQMEDGTDKDLIIGLQKYFYAIYELQNRNVGLARVKLREVSNYFKSRGLEDEFQNLSNRIEPEILFLDGNESILNQDIQTAWVKFQKASFMSKKLARSNFPEGGNEYHRFMGQSEFYLAYYTYAKFEYEFRYLNFDEIVKSEKMLEHANNANNHFGRINSDEAVLNDLRRMSKILINLSTTIFELSKIMKTTLDQHLNIDFPLISRLEKHVLDAKDQAALMEFGTEQSSIPLINYIYNIENQINYLAKYAKIEFKLTDEKKIEIVDTLIQKSKDNRIKHTDISREWGLPEDIVEDEIYRLANDGKINILYKEGINSPDDYSSVYWIVGETSEDESVVTGQFDVFISYSSKDQALIDKVKDSFDKSGIVYFIDHEQIHAGERWSDVLVIGLENSKCQLLLLTKNSNESKYVKIELDNAISLNISTIFVQFEEFELDPIFRFYTKGIQIIQAYKWSFEHSMQLVIDRIQSISSPQ